MKKKEALAWLDRLYNSKSKAIREMAYNRLKELIKVLLPE